MTTTEMIRALKAAQTRTIQHRFMCEGIRAVCEGADDIGLHGPLLEELSDCIVTADDHVSAIDHVVVLLMAQDDEDTQS